MIRQQNIKQAISNVKKKLTMMTKFSQRGGMTGLLKDAKGVGAKGAQTKVGKFSDIGPPKAKATEDAKSPVARVKMSQVKSMRKSMAATFSNSEAEQFIQSAVVFALVWSVGGSLDAESR